MALSRNFERMRMAVRARRERRERRERRDQREADEVWRDSPSALFSEGNGHSGMQSSASRPSSPASVLRSASPLSAAGRSSPTGRSRSSGEGVGFRHEISELRYYDCESIPSHDTQVWLATALSSSQGGVDIPTSCPASMSNGSVSELQHHGTGSVFRCVLLGNLAGPGRTVQGRLVTRVHNDTATMLVLELTCAHSGEQLFSSRVADLIYCDPCLETRQVSFRTTMPGASWWTLEFSRSVPMPCFWSLILADLRLSMEKRRGRLASVCAAST